MNTKTNKSVMMILMALAIGVFFTPNVVAEPAYTETDYPAYFEASMNELHVLHQRAFDQTVPAGDRERAKRDFMKNAQDLIKKMHARVMTLNVKEGAALSHTDVLLSVHVLSMVADMMASIQLEAWVDPTNL